jgi:RES domain-containing protein
MTIARAHDDRLLDAISRIAPTDYDRTVFRVVREGRAPLDGSRGAGRWNPADLTVLYCSEAREGARAEIHFHLSRGQPVFPSRMRHNLWTLSAALKTTLRLLDIDQLVALGVETARYRDLLYNRTQEIAAAAAFLEYDGLIAPSARHACANLVVFLDNAAPGALTEIASEPVDWAAYVGSRP